jgi:hypothetical protein
MLGILPLMEAFENTKENSIPFHPCLLHYLHFIMNHALLVNKTICECECYSMATTDGTPGMLPSHVDSQGL